MKGSDIILAKFMSGDDKRFVIPVYQRNYDWKIENCKQLFDDLIKVIKYKRKSHFFGSIVSVYDDEGMDEEYLIIDGQQRLTTISLLFLAMYNLLNKGVIVAKNPDLGNRILESYLIDKWKPEETKIKLKPVKNDSKAYNKLFDTPDEHEKNSNITINYNFFYNAILKMDISIDDLYNAICKLVIINIKLNSDDNPQLIFESLNSTGLALSEGDKIRNLILMGLSTEKQNLYYEKYWNKIEINTNYDVSLFIRDYLSIKEKSIPAMNKIYQVFKNYVEEKSIKIETLLEELLSYSKLYNHLLEANTKNKELNDCIYRLNRLETTVTRPFFLEILSLNRDGLLPIDELVEIFKITENYIFRRTICDLPTNQLNKIFLLLHREIINYDDTTDNYLNKFKYNLLSKREKSRFPNDEEFKISLENKNIYSMNSKNKLYIFERFENYGTKESKNIWEHFDCGDYSIEHIMPQHLTPSWINDLGDDYELIHNTWLHRLANLTITAYNSKYSNNTFEEKKTMENGFIDSGIKMNQKIAQYHQWTLNEILDRNEYMKDKAVNIWQIPTTDYVPETKQLDSCSLEDDINLTGREIIKFNFRNVEQQVSSWVEMYVKVLKTLHNEDKTILTRLAYEKDPSVDLSMHISNNKNEFSASEEIEKGIYIGTATRTSYKISLLRKFFKLFNEDTSNLIFYLKDENDEEVLLGKEGLRSKYWNYALNEIHRIHGPDGAFCNVTKSKQNWIAGYVGYKGLSILCVANVDSIRVEMYISTDETQKNKKIFDYFYENKSSIENTLGVALDWKRNDDAKASKITYSIDDVSIENESDWQRMASWHAHWSKKFYDVFVPYVMKL